MGTWKTLTDLCRKYQTKVDDRLNFFEDEDMEYALRMFKHMWKFYMINMSFLDKEGTPFARRMRREKREEEFISESEKLKKLVENRKNTESDEIPKQKTKRNYTHFNFREATIDEILTYFQNCTTELPVSDLHTTISADEINDKPIFNSSYDVQLAESLERHLTVSKKSETKLPEISILNIKSKINDFNSELYEILSPVSQNKAEVSADNPNENILVNQKTKDIEPKLNVNPYLENAFQRKEMVLKQKKKSENIYKCNKEGCNRQYTSAWGLKYHIKEGHIKGKLYEHRPYSCTIPECDKKYKNKNGLKWHIQNYHKINL